MGKNRKFKNSYMVSIEGTTTNGFQAQLFDETIRAIAKAFGINSQQCSVQVRVMETSGDFDADTRKIAQPEPVSTEKIAEGPAESETA